MSWCEGVVNGALPRTRAWCETLGGTLYRNGNEACASTQSPRAQSPHLRPVGLCWNGTGTGTGTGKRAVLDLYPYCVVEAQSQPSRALRKRSILSRQQRSNPAPPLAGVQQLGGL